MLFSSFRVQFHRLSQYSLTIAAFSLLALPAAASDSKPFKILHVMSYHIPWVWTDEQLAGFEEGLGDLPTDISVFQMDTKRRSAQEWIEKVSAEAHKIVDGQKPDLIYANDDNAQKFFAQDYVGKDVPVVFSGVNADPAAYGFTGSPNVTGVLEQEHFVQSVELLRRIVPTVRRIAVVLDSGPTWEGVVARMRSKLSEIPDIEVVHWDTIKTFEEYKEKMAAYESEVDAVALLGIFNFKGVDGADVPYVEVLRWTAEHSSIPDFSFWKSRVEGGTLVSVTVSGYQQGLAAGKMARQILTGERAPSEIEIAPTVHGKPVVSLARAKALGVRIPSSVLLSSEVIETYEWNSGG